MSLLFKKERLHEYIIHGITTYEFEPTPEYVNRTMKDPRLQSSIQKLQDTYMIVGLKVADSGTVHHLRDNSTGGGWKLGVPLPNIGGNVGGEGEATKQFESSDELVTEKPFVFAYRIRAVTARKNKKEKEYIVTAAYETPGRGAPKLYDAVSSTLILPRTSPAENTEFELSRTDGNEDMVEGPYRVISDSKETVREIVLEEKQPKWLYCTAAVGIVVYAWLIHYFVESI
jgi:hypothetical protein